MNSHVSFSGDWEGCDAEKAEFDALPVPADGKMWRIKRKRNARGLTTGYILTIIEKATGREKGQ